MENLAISPITLTSSICFQCLTSPVRSEALCARPAQFTKTSTPSWSVRIFLNTSLTCSSSLTSHLFVWNAWNWQKSCYNLDLSCLSICLSTISPDLQSGVHLLTGILKCVRHHWMFQQVRAENPQGRIQGWSEGGHGPAGGGGCPLAKVAQSNLY